MHGEAAAHTVDAAPRDEHRQPARGGRVRGAAEPLGRGPEGEEDRGDEHLAPCAEPLRDVEDEDAADERAAHARRGDGALQDGAVRHGAGPSHGAAFFAHELRLHVRRRADLLGEKRSERLVRIEINSGVGYR